MNGKRIKRSKRSKISKRIKRIKRSKRTYQKRTNRVKRNIAHKLIRRKNTRKRKRSKMRGGTSGETLNPLHSEGETAPKARGQGKETPVQVSKADNIQDLLEQVSLLSVEDSVTLNDKIVVNRDYDPNDDEIKRKRDTPQAWRGIKQAMPVQLGDTPMAMGELSKFLFRINRMNKKGLKKKLKSVGEDTSGDKADLLNRLTEWAETASPDDLPTPDPGIEPGRIDAQKRLVEIVNEWSPTEIISLKKKIARLSK